MIQYHRISMLFALALHVVLAGCATNPAGRSFPMLVDDRQMNALGIEAFSQLREQGQVSTDPAQRAYVRCITDALVEQLPTQWRQLPWETEVFVDESANAFALPGGKVGVNTGLLAIAADADQLAAVIGHELVHVIFRHGGERLSQQVLAQAGLSLASVVANSRTPENAELIVGALGAGAQIGVLLPFSRRHETEADLEGQRLMARAGFDPAAAVTLWQRMQAASQGSRPPTLLSTHPNPGGRISALQAALGEAAPIYQEALASGRQPGCRVSRQVRR